MAQKFNPAAFRQQMRKAQAAARDLQRAADKLKRDVHHYDREAQQQNRRTAHAVAAYNNKVDAHNREVQRRNRAAQQGSSRRTVHFTVSEQELADRLQEAIPTQGQRDHDVFLSYARRDGYEVARELCQELEDLGVDVWFDEVAIRPGKSLARQMDEGLRKARAGVVLVTPVYLTGRLWPERELGALLHKPTVIPVLHQVRFEDVASFSAMLSDLAGFSTEHDAVSEIAAKIGAAVLDTEERE
ncbi:toll/interleukin-1 receptor domain-containing protein [Streptomyces calvus]